MDRLDHYRVFARVAELGSFIQAAHALDLPRATVSAAVARLESRLGVRLLDRTTRRVRITADGQALLERLRPLLADADEIEHLFATQGRQIAGSLCIDAPSRLTRRLIVPALPGLLRRHPRLQLTIGSTDRIVDLVAAGVDCAVRIGPLADSGLVARPLGHLSLVNCASPAYLAEHGVPETVAALRDGHWMVGYADPRTARPTPWETIDGAGQADAFPLPSRVSVDSVDAYLSGALAGLGLIQVPRFDVAPLIEAGRLVEILPANRPPPLPIALVMPHRRGRSRRLQAFIDWLEALIQPHLDR